MRRSKHRIRASLKRGKRYTSQNGTLLLPDLEVQNIAGTFERQRAGGVCATACSDSEYGDGKSRTHTVNLWLG